MKQERHPRPHHAILMSLVKIESLHFCISFKRGCHAFAFILLSARARRNKRVGGQGIRYLSLKGRMGKRSGVLCREKCGWTKVHVYVNWRCFRISKTNQPNHQINEEIRDKEIRVIDSEGNQLGIMATEKALELAYDNDHDLVMIAPGGKPPVCKIMDYGKYRFEQAKREKEAKKNQHVVEVKEIRMSPSIDTHDFNVKLKNGRKFLGEGNRLKVTVRFRGREMAHTDIGANLLKRFAAECEDVATVDKNAKLEGRFMSMFLSPRTQKPAD